MLRERVVIFESTAHLSSKLQHLYAAFSIFFRWTRDRYVISNAAPNTIFDHAALRQQTLATPHAYNRNEQIQRFQPPNNMVRQRVSQALFLRFYLRNFHTRNDVEQSVHIHILWVYLDSLNIYQ